MECLLKCLYSKKPPLSGKIPGCSPDICSNYIGKVIRNIALLKCFFFNLVHGKVKGLAVL